MRHCAAVPCGSVWDIPDRYSVLRRRQNGFVFQDTALFYPKSTTRDMLCQQKKGGMVRPQSAYGTETVFFLVSIRFEKYTTIIITGMA